MGNVSMRFFPSTAYHSTNPYHIDFLNYKCGEIIYNLYQSFQKPKKKKVLSWNRMNVKGRLMIVKPGLAFESECGFISY